MKRSYWIGAGVAVAALAVAAVLYATGALGDRSEKPSNDPVLAMDVMPMVGDDDKCAYFDAKGAQAIATRYDNAGLFLKRSGLAVVEVGKKYGIIDRKGVYTANPQFEELHTADGDTLFYARLGENWGIVDQTGKYIANPQFKTTSPFGRDGLAAVGNGKKMGMIDTSGKWVIQPQFDEIRASYPEIVFAQLPVYFVDGLAAARMGDKWGFIDKDGRWKINPQFAGVGLFDGSGLAPAATAQADGKTTWGFIDEDGKWKVNPQFAGVYAFWNEKLAAVQNADTGWGFIDRDGKLAINPRFASVGLFSKAGGKLLAPAVEKAGTDNKLGYIDEKGAFAITPQFASAGTFDRNQRARVKFGNQWGLIGPDGVFAVNPAYDSLTAIQGADYYLFEAEDPAADGDDIGDLFSERFGLIDANGKEKAVWTGEPCFNF